MTFPPKFRTSGRDRTFETVVLSTRVSLAKHLEVTNYIISGMYRRVVKLGRKDNWCVLGSVCIDNHSTVYLGMLVNHTWNEVPTSSIPTHLVPALDNRTTPSINLNKPEDTVLIYGMVIRGYFVPSESNIGKSARWSTFSLSFRRVNRIFGRLVTNCPCVLLQLDKKSVTI